MTYDPKCYNLAELFLLDCDVPPAEEPKLRHELAQRIQTAIEDFLQEKELS